jgi:hypothetical protein
MMHSSGPDLTQGLGRLAWPSGQIGQTGPTDGVARRARDRRAQLRRGGAATGDNATRCGGTGSYGMRTTARGSLTRSQWPRLTGADG